MKISLNWLKKYVAVPEDMSDAELVRLIGARLVEVEGVIDEIHKYDKIYVVRVESCEKIPGTHLTLCQVDCGAAELVQVVCGAPNVRAGMLAVWIAPGAVVPASVHEDAPFVIGKRKMQGYESNGMLAGADELDFGDDHSGIVEIEPEVAQPGDLLAEVLELDDLILEIENKSLTHRPDCFGIIGFAREVAGILGVEFAPALAGLGFLNTLYAGKRGEPLLRDGSVRLNKNMRVKNSNQNLMPHKKPALNLAIEITQPEICPRYTAVVLERHGEIRKKYLTWEDTVLSKAGMKPISPIVDATNFLMLLTGQPLHAFDYDKFVVAGGGDSPRITVRLAQKGEKLTLLDDNIVNLDENDIVICSGDTPVALAGAMGGKTTMIDENTKNVILESATFSLYNLRKTQMAHGIFSEAITRFTKGQPPYQTMAVAEACADMLADGFRVTGVADVYSRPEQTIVVKITTDEINRLLGTEYSKETIVKTLENVGFRIRARHDTFEIQVPEWRTDIHIKEDIIEEVGRLLGYDNIAPTLPLHMTANKNQMWDLKKTTRQLMMRLGANELLTYSFVSEKLLVRMGQDPANSYKIINSISPELQYVRQTIVPSLLEKVYLNEKLPVERFAIYEINKVCEKAFGMDEEGVPIEQTRLGLVVAERKNHETAYYKAKKYVAKFLAENGISAKFLPMAQKDTLTQPYESRRAAEIMVEGERIGVVGEIRNSIRNELKLAPYLAAAEIDMDAVLRLRKQTHRIRLGRRECQDITVTTDKNYAEIEAEVRAKYPDAVITPGTIYQAPGQKTKNITLHIELML